jgi:hypothetical protein
LHLYMHGFRRFSVLHQKQYILIHPHTQYSKFLFKQIKKFNGNIPFVRIQH